jgi:Fe2+ or Zn2+ uptake regulation protein
LDIIKEDIILILEKNSKPITFEDFLDYEYLGYADRSQIYFALETLATQGIIHKIYMDNELPVYSV